MLISASVRPRNLKRGTTDKKLCQLLGFKEAVGLSQLCGRIELSAEQPGEFGFLTNLFRAFQPLKDDKKVRVVIEINGKPSCAYTREPAKEKLNAD